MQKRGLDRKPMEMDRQNVDGHGYMGDGKESRLLHCLRGVITKVLIVFWCHDGRDLLQGMFGVFTEEDRWFLLIYRRSFHEAFTSPMLHRGDRLYTLSH